MSGYAPDRVQRFCQEHGRVREDGRVMRLAGTVLPESYRNTLLRWHDTPPACAPLGRWDEILLDAGVMLWEYELWECQTYGDLSFRETC